LLVAEGVESEDSLALDHLAAGRLNGRLDRYVPRERDPSHYGGARRQKDKDHDRYVLSTCHSSLLAE
jgi:hypothetical protein